MAKLPRKFLKLFGATAGGTQIAKFGSLVAGTPVFTTDPEVIQGLANYDQGWFSGVIGNGNPAIEDVNGLEYLTSYQLNYLMQAGVAEWNSATTYYVGSIVNDGTGKIFKSKQDTNLNHLLSDAAWWAEAGGAGGLVPKVQTTDINPAVTNTSYNYGVLVTPSLLTLPTGTSAFSIEVVGSADLTNTLSVAGVNGDTEVYEFPNFTAVYYRAEGSSVVSVSRQAATLVSNESGDFTGSFTGAAAGSVVFTFARMNQNITISLPSVNIASTSTTGFSCPAGTLPASLRPSTNKTFNPAYYSVGGSGVNLFTLFVNANGSMEFRKEAGGLFSSGTTYVLPSTAISYVSQ